MKTKIVYVLTSDESDIYLEQTLLSVFSLRMHNREAFVELVVDKCSDEALVNKRAEILKYIDFKNVISVPSHYNKIQSSRWLKTSLRKHVDGDYLFIDSDTIITDDLSAIDNVESDIAAVPDGHVNLGVIPYNSTKLKALAEKDGWTYNEDQPYYNSGVMFVKDSELACRLYDNWHTAWKKGVAEGKHVLDQSYLAASNERLGYVIQKLDGVWNCQIVRNGLPYFVDAKIIHLLGFGFHSQCPPWRFYDKKIYDEIKAFGCIPDSVSQLVNNAKYAFSDSVTIVADEEAAIVRSRLFRILRKHPQIGSIYDSISRFIKP